VYFGFSDEQVMLRESVRRFLDQRCPLKEVRKLKVTPRGFSEALWQKMAQAGWLGVALPEQYGGLGLGWLDLIVIIEEMGRSVFPSPFLSNTLAATAIHEFGNAQQKQQTLPGLIDGSRKATLALFEESAAISLDSMLVKGRYTRRSAGVERRQAHCHGSRNGRMLRRVVPLWRQRR
jgi:alkylation response protein AidB-like acyl-CoA dehydrogenase